MLAKNIKKQERITYIWRAVYLVEELKANMQIGIDIITQEQFVLDFNKKTAFIRSCFCLFDLDIEIPRASI